MTECFFFSWTNSLRWSYTLEFNRIGEESSLTVRANRFAKRIGLPRRQWPKSGARLQRRSFTRDWEEWCICVCELDGAGVGWVLPVSHVGMRGNEKLEWERIDWRRREKRILEYHHRRSHNKRVSSAHSCVHTSVRKKQTVTVNSRNEHSCAGSTVPCVHEEYCSNLMDLDPIFVRDCALIVTRVGFIGSNRALILTFRGLCWRQFQSLCYTTSAQTHCVVFYTEFLFIKCTAAGFDDSLLFYKLSYFNQQKLLPSIA